MLLLALVTLSVACAAEPPRDATGSIAEGGDLSVFRFRVGDCFNDPRDGSAEVTSVEAVPCSTSHDNEVFYMFELPEGSLPDDDAIDQWVADHCVPAFESYVGTSYESSELYLFPITPTEDSWADGDREVVCALYAQGEELSASMRDSGR